MELTILLSKVFGLYCIIMGLALVFKNTYFNTVINSFIENRSVRLVTSSIFTLIGLFLVNVHNEWSTTNTFLVSLIGWFILIKGVAHLFISQQMMQRIVKGSRAYTRAGGIVALILGIYLANAGFGWF